MIIIKVKWLGNSALLIEDKKNIVIDPSFKLETDFEADIVLITHEHDDHINPEHLAAVSNEQTKVFAPQSVYDKFEIEGEVVKAGDVLEEEIKVLDVDCYQAEESVAYFYKGLYQTADASDYPDPEEEIELLFTACFNDHFSDYLEKAIKLSPAMAVPYHYDPEERQELLQAKGLSSKFEQIGCKSKVIEVGEELEL
ncbi:L-ascorbate metabolism protein UlaG (beta-lactamase superfamily) [Halanaerobium saccharolyticum]|uniref:L-ascorbate metabolism protein UlaG (Beta-lactamase superfamily) n=1 Tax=Halanaerobium saccharolyticum TaxID=43595 RepID=A0A4R7YS99_9FIRM|nr:MBL fold metallo-hydrolase [Halanaerobium saccharolyticum]RAK06329.1 L-ascorbate metabolism protein UlaG (beta-lactamase superfamily) [Halanaerobium saccharolyticum]TDW00641.1 L-ascorbate metabolism protein UlaG (beta-lactamase superfamily) [Halanaerobium saccharolyticum]TDX52254.1 L-ascorbate metabolism protein UlaG (beta-lactamase superfamily) [Halanaerobium saccharolyticum]